MNKLIKTLQRYATNERLVYVVYSSIGAISLLETLDDNLTNWEMLLSLIGLGVSIFLVKTLSYIIAGKSFSHIGALTGLFCPLILPVFFFILSISGLYVFRDAVDYSEGAIFFTMFVFTSLTYSRKHDRLKSLAMGALAALAIFLFSMVVSYVRSFL